MDLRAPALEKVEGGRRRVRLEVGARAVALQGVGPARDLPLQLGLGEVGGLRQADEHARARCLHPSEVYLARERSDPEARERPATAVEGKVLPGPAVEPARRHDPGVLSAEVPLLRMREGRLVPGMALVDRVPERILLDEDLPSRPVVVERRPEQDADAQIDLDEVGRDQLVIDHDSGRHVHLAAPLRHGLVPEIAGVWVLERAPAAQQHAALAHPLVAGKRLVEEVEQVVVQRHHPLDEVDVPGEPHQVFVEQLHRRNGADAPRVERGRVHVAPLHQAEHLAGQPAHLQRLLVERAGEGVQRPHDVRDGAVSVYLGVRGGGGLGLGEHARVRFLHHPLAKVDPHQVVLEEVVVEHVLGGLPAVDDPLRDRRRLHAEGHVLRVDAASGVVAAADPTDAAADLVGIARVLSPHEDAVAAEDGRGAAAIDHLAVLEVDPGVDTEAPDDARDGVPRHLHQLAVAHVLPPGPRQEGSRFIDSTVNCRSARTVRP